MPVASWVATRKQNLSSHVQVVPGQRWRGHLTQGRKVFFVPVRIEQKNLGGNDMIDLKFLRENPEVVKQNIKNKFQDHKLPLVDEVIELDAEARKTQQEADDLRAKRNQLSKEIGKLMGQGKKDEAEAVKTQVAEGAARLAELEEKEKELQEKVTKIMMTIPNIIDPSVPIGKDDSCNVEIEKFGEPVVPDFEIMLIEKSLSPTTSIRCLIYVLLMLFPT